MPDLPFSVLLVDDDAMVRTGLRTIIGASEDVVVCGEAASGEEAIDQVLQHRPDIVLMDIRMPGMGGIEAIRSIVNGLHAPQVVALTSFDSDDYLMRSLEAGAVGFIVKDIAPTDLIDALRTVRAGNAFVSPSSTRALVRHAGRSAAFSERHRAREQMAGLSERERAVAELVAEGASNRQIAQELFMSESTVKTHLSSVMVKLAADSRVAVAIIADRARGAQAE